MARYRIIDGRLQLVDVLPDRQGAIASGIVRELERFPALEGEGFCRIWLGRDEAGLFVRDYFGETDRVRAVGLARVSPRDVAAAIAEIDDIW